MSGSTGLVTCALNPSGKAAFAPSYPNPLRATTGTEALEIFSSHNGDVDLVVSDVVMPEMDGPTLMKHLRSERPDVKIIFISGYAEDAFKRNLSENDEDFMFLQKPFDLKELAAAVKAALQN